MSEENVEVVRRNADAFNGGDFEEWLQMFDPDATFEPRRASIQGTYRGRAGIRDWLADTEQSFEEFQLQISDIRDLGDDRVLSFGTVHVRGRGSGIETDIPSAAILTLREGTITGFKDYGEREKALQAAGLTLGS